MRSRVTLSLLVIVCLFVTSCEVAQKLIDDKKKERAFTAKTYEKNGFSISHPDNWKVTEDENIDGRARYINLEDSDNTVFAITLFPAEFKTELKDYAESIKNSLPSNVPIGKISDVRVSQTSREVLGKFSNGIRHNLSITLLGQKIPHTQEFFKIEGKKFDGIVMVQAPDEDWQAAEKEFKLMFESVKFE